MKYEAERAAVTPQTDYDFDKESWMKSMRFASMECVMDPDVTPIKYTSFAGARKAFSRWLTMRKLLERRPGFAVEDLKVLYTTYKRLSSSSDPSAWKQLTRFTTFGEAQRLEKEAQLRVGSDSTKKSWKAYQVNQSGENSQVESELVIDTFELINCFIGQMTNEDWLQVTVKVSGKQRISSTAEFTPLTEFPVFEVRLGDGIRTSNNASFIIVAVMDKGGSRYGRDGQDAAVLRKNLARQKKSGWFGGLFGGK